MNEPETTLTGETQKSQPPNFADLVETYQHKLFNTVLRMTGNQDDALDIVQDVFLKAYRSLDKFRGRAKIYTWLYRIAVNTALSFRRSAAVQMSRSSVSLDEDLRHEDSESRREVADERYEASSTLGNRETRQRVSEAIAGLEPELRTVVVLRDVEELNYEDIAEILEVPKGTVKSRLHRGRLALRDKLKEFL